MIRRLALILIATGLLALAQAGHAAVLKAGWYANIYSVDLFGYDSQGLPRLITGGQFTAPLGEYGPFQLTDAPYHWTDSRSADILVDALSVQPAQSLPLTISFPVAVGMRVAYMDISWATNYDPSQMTLQFWHRDIRGTDTLAWQQLTAGRKVGETQVMEDTNYEGAYYFRVNVVTEPTSLLSLSLPLLVVFRRRMSRR